MQGEDQGESWRASFDEPGILDQDGFQDRGYRWLVVRLTEGPKGGGKTITVNGKRIGRFTRTGPSVQIEKEWWVTRSFPIPEGLLERTDGDPFHRTGRRHSRRGPLVAQRIPDADE